MSGHRRAPRRAARSVGDPPGGARPGVLLVSASMGGGHDGVAYELQRRVRAAGGRADVVDFIDVLPWRTGRVVKATYLAQLRYAPESYEWLYATLERSRTAEAVARAFSGLARRRLRRVAQRGRYGAVVATYPLAGQALGRLRREGRLAVPALTFLTDADVHEMWLDPGTDEYLAVYPASVCEARRRGARSVRLVGPVVGPSHGGPVTAAERDRAREALGLEAPGAPVVLVVAGAWGTGDVARTALVLAGSGVARPVVLCGRNDDLRDRLSALPGVRAVGWAEDVRGVLAAADLLVHNAGGLTALEAFAAGVPVVGHSCLPGHGRRNAAALRAAGIADLAGDDAELVDMVLRYAGTPGGAAMAARARMLFRPDIAPDLVARARIGTLAAAAHRRRVVARRAVRTAVAVALSTAVLGPWAGPAVAQGLDEVAEQSAGAVRPPTGVEVVWAGALLDESEVGDPSVARLLGGAGLSAVVPASVAARQAAEVRALRGGGVAVLGGVVRLPGVLHPLADRRAVRGAALAVGHASGEARVPVVVPDTVSDALLRGTGDRLGVADAVVRRGAAPRLHRAEAVLLDLRGLPAGPRAALVDAFAARARACGLRLRPWGRLWGIG